MSDLYYRGSSTYEVAVQNRLKSLERAGAETNYAVRAMGAEISGAVRENTYALVASQALLAKTFAQGFDSMNNTISLGFSNMESKLDEVADRICSKLDEIHDIVNNPLLTASRELYRRALTNYDKGFYEEALEDCKAAVEKNKTDAISWDLLGQIYLYGAGKFSNVIDLDKAEESLSNAAKYVDPDIGKSDEANELASEIYYNLGYVRLVKSNDLLVQNKAEESNSKLLEAESASGKAYQISKDNLLAAYEQAKELHFLGKDDESVELLGKIIWNDCDYALRASCDKNFESLWDKIDDLIKRLTGEMEMQVNHKILRFMPTMQKLKKLGSKSEDPCVTDFKKDFNRLKSSVGKDYFSVYHALNNTAYFVESSYKRLCENVSSLSSELGFFVDSVNQQISYGCSAEVNFNAKLSGNPKTDDGIVIEYHEKYKKDYIVIVNHLNGNSERIGVNITYDEDRMFNILHCFKDNLASLKGVYIKGSYDDCYLVPLMPLIQLLNQRAECFPEESQGLHESLNALQETIDGIVGAQKKHKEEFDKNNKDFFRFSLICLAIEAVLVFLLRGKSWDDSIGRHLLLGIIAIAGACGGLCGTKRLDALPCGIAAVVFFILNHRAVAVINAIGSILMFFSVKEKK